MNTYDLLIGGRRRPSGDGATFTVYEPATGAPLADVAKATTADIGAAVGSAHQAFETGTWRTRPASARGRVLHRVAEIVRSRLGEIAELESRNGGKPIGGAEWEVGNCADLFEYYGGAADKLMGEVPPVDKPGLCVILREPVGPCALIVPWNFPLVLLARKLAPALAAGNPVVIKPASYTPLTALLLGEILVEAGVPPEGVNVVPGHGALIGDALCGDARITKISFTGEAVTGAEIVRKSAGNIARLSLELGGKSACVVFADADLAACVEAMPGGVFDNAGQDCCARSRILVERRVYDDFVARFAARTDAMNVGQPADRAVEMGPLISARQRQTALDYIRLGIEAGAELVAGGGPVADPTLSGGFFLRPAVLAGVDNSMRVAQEEIFGPVASVIAFDDEDDAIRIANDSPFGLSGSLWTRDLGRALRVSKAMRTGILSVNSNSSAHTQSTFGGFKKSGLGRELGLGALDHYTEMRSIHYSSV